MSFARLRAADWVAFIAALALLLVTAVDWYSTIQGEQAREFEQSAPTRGEDAQLQDDAALVAEAQERNAWQVDGAIDRLILAGLLGTSALAVYSAFARAAGRAGDGGWAATGAAAVLTALLVLYRILQEPGFDAVTTVQIGAPLGLGVLGVIAFASALSLREEPEASAGGGVLRAPALAAALVLLGSGTPAAAQDDLLERHRPAAALRRRRGELCHRGRGAHSPRTARATLRRPRPSTAPELPRRPLRRWPARARGRPPRRDRRATRRRRLPDRVWAPHPRRGRAHLAPVLALLCRQRPGSRPASHRSPRGRLGARAGAARPRKATGRGDLRAAHLGRGLRLERGRAGGGGPGRIRGQRLARRVRPTVLAIGAATPRWMTWPGRWGASAGGWVPGEQPSPRGPAFQPARWVDPGHFHATEAVPCGAGPPGRLWQTALTVALAALALGGGALILLRRSYNRGR